MPRFLIEREIPEAGRLSPEQLRRISQESCSVPGRLDPRSQWVESCVTDDKVYGVHIAPDQALPLEHAGLNGFPANRVARFRAVIDPTPSE